MDNERGPAYRVMQADIEQLIATLPQGRADELVEEVYGSSHSDEGAAA